MSNFLCKSNLRVCTLLLSQFLVNVMLTSAGGLSTFSKSCSKPMIDIKVSTESTASSSRLQLSNNLLQVAGNLLDPSSAQKMRKVSKQWETVKIYEPIFNYDHDMAVYRNVNTDKIIWETASFKQKKFFSFYKIPNKDALLRLLRQNDDTKWNDVFWWCLENWKYESKHENEQNELLLKKLLLEVAENIDVAFIISDQYFVEYVPLFLAADMGDTDSISKLIQRGASVDSTYYFWTSLMVAAYHGHDNAVQLLLDAGANRNITKGGQTALQIAQEKGHKNCVEILRQ